MNENFRLRQREVFEVLSIIAKRADREGELLIFIGGSAVQVVIKEPKRLSIDLDILYSGNVDGLLLVLKEHYSLIKRQAVFGEIFSFYKAVKKEVEVKIDIIRIKKGDFGGMHKLRKIKVGGKMFEVNVGTAEFLLASKFAALGIGTIGRRRDRDSFQSDLLKDVFDSISLIDEFGVNDAVWGNFSYVSGFENKLKKTSFSEKQAIESAISALRKSTQLNDEDPFLTKGSFGEFQQYQFANLLNLRGYWVMAYRLSAYLRVFSDAEGKGMPALIRKIDQSVKSNEKDTKLFVEIGKKLAGYGMSKDHLHELKIIRPDAFLYLYLSFEPNGLENIKT